MFCPGERAIGAYWGGRNEGTGAGLCVPEEGRSLMEGGGWTEGGNIPLGKVPGDYDVAWGEVGSSNIYTVKPEERTEKWKSH